MLRTTGLCFALVLMLLVGMLSANRQQGEGIYLLLSPESGVNPSGLYYQSLYSSKRHPVKGIVDRDGSYFSPVFSRMPEAPLWREGDRWIYFRTSESLLDFPALEESYLECLYRTTLDAENSQKIACHVLDDYFTWDTSNGFQRSPNNKWLVYSLSTRLNTTLMLVETDGTNQRVLLENFPEIINYFRWSFDSEWIYFSTVSTPQETPPFKFYRLNLKTKLVEMIVETDERIDPPVWTWLNPTTMFMTAMAGKPYILFTLDVTTGKFVRAVETNRHWIRNEKWIIYINPSPNEQYEMFRVHLDGSALEKIGVFNQEPYLYDITSDNSKVVFRGETTDTLCWINLQDIQEQHCFSDNRFGDTFYPPARNDGIYFTTQESTIPYANLYRLGFDGKLDKLLSLHNEIIDEFDITPDEKHIIVRVSSTPPLQTISIISMNLDGSDAHRVAVDGDFYTGDFYFTALSPAIDIPRHSRQLILGGIALMVMSLVYWRRKFA